MTTELLVHKSDCAIYNEPYSRALPCNCGYEIKLEEHAQSLTESLQEMNSLVESCQAVLTSYLLPDGGLSAPKAINMLLGLLDSQNQRDIQDNATSLLRRKVL